MCANLPHIMITVEENRIEITGMVILARSVMIGIETIGVAALAMIALTEIGAISTDHDLILLYLLGPP